MIIIITNAIIDFYFQPEQKVDLNAVDSKSLQGIFGWEKVNDTVLPVIFRENERLVPVRIVESKVGLFTICFYLYLYLYLYVIKGY